MRYMVEHLKSKVKQINEVRVLALRHDIDFMRNLDMRENLTNTTEIGSNFVPP